MLINGKPCRVDEFRKNADDDGRWSAEFLYAFFPWNPVMIILLKVNQYRNGVLPTVRCVIEINE